MFALSVTISKTVAVKMCRALTLAFRMSQSQVLICKSKGNMSFYLTMAIVTRFDTIRNIITYKLQNIFNLNLTFKLQVRVMKYIVANCIIHGNFYYIKFSEKKCIFISNHFFVVPSSHAHIPVHNLHMTWTHGHRPTLAKGDVQHVTLCVKKSLTEKNGNIKFPVIFSSNTVIFIILLKSSSCNHSILFNFVLSAPNSNANTTKLSAVCHLPKETESCGDYTIKWFFDSAVGICTRFWYGGCDPGASANRFDSETDCSGICIDPPGTGKQPVIPDTITCYTWYNYM